MKEKIHKDLLDDQKLEFIADVPSGAHVPLVLMAVKARAFGTNRLQALVADFREEYLALSTAVEARRAILVAEVMKSNPQEPFNDGLGDPEWGGAGKEAEPEPKRQRRRLWGARRGFA